MLMKPVNDELLEGLFCFGDLYKRMGILELGAGVGGFINHIDQIRANKKTIDYIHDKFKANVMKSKDKRVKGYTDLYKERAVAWDFVLWAPFADETIPDMTIGLDEDREKYDKLS